MCYGKIVDFAANQLSPMHTHVIKAEDIINRDGAAWWWSCLALMLRADLPKIRAARSCDGLAAILPQEKPALRPASPHAW